MIADNLTKNKMYLLKEIQTENSKQSAIKFKQNLAKSGIKNYYRKDRQIIEYGNNCREKKASQQGHSQAI